MSPDLRQTTTDRSGRCDHSQTGLGSGIQSETEHEYTVTSLLRIVRSPALFALMLGHFSNDMLGGVLPVLFPTMKLQYGL
jgi:hypothetical protein